MNKKLGNSEIRVTCPHVMEGHLFVVSDSIKVFTQDPETIESMLKRLNLPSGNNKMFAANLLEAGGDVSFHVNGYDAIQAVHDHYQEHGMTLDYR